MLSRISLSDAAEMPFDDLWRVAAPPMPSPAMLLCGNHDAEQVVLHGMRPFGAFAPPPSFGFPGAAGPRLVRTATAPGPLPTRSSLLPQPAPTPSPSSASEAKPPQRVRKSVLSRLQQRKATAADMDQVCNVCMDHFSRGTRVTTLPCEHAFCTDCITPWLQRHATCPVCRWEFPPEETTAAAPQLSV